MFLDGNSCWNEYSLCRRHLVQDHVQDGWFSRSTAVLAILSHISKELDVSPSKSHEQQPGPLSTWYCFIRYWDEFLKTRGTGTIRRRSALNHLRHWQYKWCLCSTDIFLEGYGDPQRLTMTVEEKDESRKRILDSIRPWQVPLAKVVLGDWVQSYVMTVVPVEIWSRSMVCSLGYLLYCIWFWSGGKRDDVEMNVRSVNQTK